MSISASCAVKTATCAMAVKICPFPYDTGIEGPRPGRKVGTGNGAERDGKNQDRDM